jgi:hypothetical protein
MWATCPYRRGKRPCFVIIHPSPKGCLCTSITKQTQIPPLLNWATFLDSGLSSLVYFTKQSQTWTQQPPKNKTNPNCSTVALGCDPKRTNESKLNIFFTYYCLRGSIKYTTSFLSRLIGIGKMQGYLPGISAGFEFV